MAREFMIEMRPKLASMLNWIGTLERSSLPDDSDKWVDYVLARAQSDMPELPILHVSKRWVCIGMSHGSWNVEFTLQVLRGATELTCVILNNYLWRRGRLPRPGHVDCKLFVQMPGATIWKYNDDTEHRYLYDRKELGIRGNYFTGAAMAAEFLDYLQYYVS
ncbi:hypothetical protein EBT31_08590 [bacterium]|jgi:hypothetical protein|nr:hypothetical protein [bacterium]